MATSNMVAVVTVGFYEQCAERVEMALREVERLGIRRAVLVHDTEGESGTAATTAEKRFSSKSLEVSVLKVVEADTAVRWRRGVILAFEDPNVDEVFIFPSDFDEEPERVIRESWSSMIERANESRLVAGSYVSKPGSFKESFEDLVARPVLAALFPEDAPGLSDLQKVRTEFLILGRRVFERLQEDGIPWSCDPTPDVALAALRHSDLSFEVIDLGRFVDDEGTRGPIGQILQLTRFVAQLVVSRIRLEQTALHAAPEEEQVLVHDKLRDQVKEAFALCLEAIDANRSSERFSSRQ